MAVLIRKNDTVQVISGKNGGKLKSDGASNRKVGRQGRVLSVDRKTGKAIVEGVNISKKHEKANQQANVPGGRIDKPMPLPLSILRLVCPSCGPVRVRITRARTDRPDGTSSVVVERQCVKCEHNFG